MIRTDKELQELREQLKRKNIIGLLLFVDMTANQPYDIRMQGISEVAEEIIKRIKN